MNRPSHRLLTLVIFALSAASLAAQEKADESKKTEAKKPSLPSKWVETLQWRSIGPANMSGRIVALAVYEKDPNIWWAATASGGLLKTTNNGVTFEHQFDREATVSIGDVQVAQSDPEHCLGRHRRSESSQQRVVGRRRVQVDRRRQDLDEHGAEEDLPDRSHRDSPDESRHRLRRRTRETVGPERRSRALSRRPMAARPGRRFSTSTTRRVSSTCR